MKITKTQIAIIAVVAVSFIVSAALYNRLPEEMASHWNAKGEVDGYMSRVIGAFLMPCMLAGIVLMLQVVLLIDPLKKNIQKFRQYYDGAILAIALFVVSVHSWMLLWNVGIKLNLNIVMSLGSGLLFFFLGFIMRNIKQNWFMGIRTPWTLSNEFVWRKTHEHCGIVFMAAGVIAMSGVFFGNLAFLFIAVSAIGASVYSIIYSYVVYRSVGTDKLDPMRPQDSSGDVDWDDLKEGYLFQVKKALSKVKHARKKEVLSDVRAHLDSRFDELSKEERTWENYQQIITEMGPATDYAELLGEGCAMASKSPAKQLVLFLLIGVVVVAIILGAVAVSKSSDKSVIRTDKIDYEFVSDPEIVGHWESVDFVRYIVQFRPGKRQWRGELYLKNMQFFENGSTAGPWNWTKDLIIHPGDKTAAKYHIETIEGSTYMFFEWKSGDYTIGRMPPQYYVLKKVVNSQTSTDSVEIDIALVSLRIVPKGDEYIIVAKIVNEGKMKSPEFDLFFYNGDPDKTTPATHQAGPIEPANEWNAASLPFQLQEGLNEFTVVIDPKNTIGETDETNNKKRLELEFDDGIIDRIQITGKTFTE